MIDRAATYHRSNFREFRELLQASVSLHVHERNTHSKVVFRDQMRWTTWHITHWDGVQHVVKARYSILITQSFHFQPYLLIRPETPHYIHELTATIQEVLLSFLSSAM